MLRYMIAVPICATIHISLYLTLGLAALATEGAPVPNLLQEALAILGFPMLSLAFPRSQLESFIGLDHATVLLAIINGALWGICLTLVYGKFHRPRGPFSSVT
jgi:hypothetical protein